MINHNYRTMISQFIPLQQRANEPHIEKITEERRAGSFINMNMVPGNSNSSIEKMTHPLAGYNETGPISPYMMALLGDKRALDFADSVIHAQKKRVLDKLGIDDNSGDRRSQQRNDMEVVTRFYPRDVQWQPKKIELNGQPFIEQEPTKPYFFGQKVITPDFTLFRAAQEEQRKNLLLCKTRDDSSLFFNKSPITKLVAYNNEVFINESEMRAGDKFLNKPQYFTAMVEYLIHFSRPGDVMVQNSLETSSDKNTPHLQFIPGDVPLPLFYENIQSFADSEYQYIDWYLPTLLVTVDSRQAGWQARTEQVQEACQQLLLNQNISTTPIFKYQGEGLVALYLIFKQDGSDMTLKARQLAPGWLESCGIFIADTSKAEMFSTQGAQQYYKPYGVVEREQLFATICDSLGHSTADRPK